MTDLTYEEEQDIWAIACAKGINKIQARKIWESQQKQKQQKNPEPQPAPSTQEQPVKTEESQAIDLESWKAQLEKEEYEEEIKERKLKILDKIETQLDHEEKSSEVWLQVQNLPELEEKMLLILEAVQSLARHQTEKCLVTIEHVQDGSWLHFDFKFFDKDGKQILLEQFTENLSEQKDD